MPGSGGIPLPHDRVVDRHQESTTNIPGIPDSPLSTCVSTQRKMVFTCQAVGGFPSPTIEWWIGTKNLQPKYQVYLTLPSPPGCLRREGEGCHLQGGGGFLSPTIEWWIGTKNLQPTYQVCLTLHSPLVCLRRERWRSGARQWGDSPPPP